MVWRVQSKKTPFSDLKSASEMTVVCVICVKRASFVFCSGTEGEARTSIDTGEDIRKVRGQLQLPRNAVLDDDPLNTADTTQCAASRRCSPCVRHEVNKSGELQTQETGGGGGVNFISAPVSQSVSL